MIMWNPGVPEPANATLHEPRDAEERRVVQEFMRLRAELEKGNANRHARRRFEVMCKRLEKLELLVMDAGTD